MMSLLIGYGIATGLASGLVLACGVARACRRTPGAEPVRERGPRPTQLRQFPA